MDIWTLHNCSNDFFSTKFEKKEGRHAHLGWTVGLKCFVHFPNNVFFYLVMSAFKCKEMQYNICMDLLGFACK